MIKLIWEEGIYNHNEVFNFSGTHDFKMEIYMADMDAAEEFCIYQSAFGCLPEFEEECLKIRCCCQQIIVKHLLCMNGSYLTLMHEHDC